MLDVIKSSADRTPDFEELNQGDHELHLVFVYDGLKRNRPLHPSLGDAQYYGMAQTASSNFLMVRPTPMTPVAVEMMYNRGLHMYQSPDKQSVYAYNELGAVEGEVYGVPLRALTNLDKIEVNGQVTNRRKLLVRFLEGNQRGTCHPMFMWEGAFDYWDPLRSFKTAKKAESLTRQNQKVYYF